jgi:hypothetical protein
MKGLGKARRVDDAWVLMERWEARVRRRLERKAGFGTLAPTSVLGLVPEELIYSLMNACAETGDVARARAVMFRFNGSFIANERVFNLLMKVRKLSPSLTHVLAMWSASSAIHRWAVGRLPCFKHLIFQPMWRGEKSLGVVKRIMGMDGWDGLTTVLHSRACNRALKHQNSCL